MNKKRHEVGTDISWREGFQGDLEGGILKSGHIKYSVYMNFKEGIKILFYKGVPYWG